MNVISIFEFLVVLSLLHPVCGVQKSKKLPLLLLTVNIICRELAKNVFFPQILQKNVFWKCTSTVKLFDGHFEA